ncbi:RICIN domain-containing protein [Streptomyces sp. NPDC046988]|uniref:RICIN domain-containing protein n=1 Tax=Streptomyces sp. NPDC046988 TaxID=3154922 RepID=UPI0033E3D879
MRRHRPAVRGALMAGAVTVLALGAVAPPGHLTGLGSKCADLAGSGSTNAGGTAVTLQVCDGTYGQMWKAGADGSLVNTLSGRCLDATDAGSAYGTKLQIWTCGGSAQQKWDLPASA